jgi:hypothetical protein
MLSSEEVGRSEDRRADGHEGTLFPLYQLPVRRPIGKDAFGVRVRRSAKGKDETLGVVRSARQKYKKAPISERLTPHGKNSTDKTKGGCLI